MTQYTTDTPCIIKETSQGFGIYRIEDEMFMNREIELTGNISSERINALIRELRYLQSQDADKEITIFINSPGGEVTSGLALYDVMQAISCPIKTVCLGSAASMAAIIFIAGDSREMLPHSRIMIHDPLMASGPGGSALTIKAISEDLMRVRETIAGIIAKHSALDLEEVYKLTAQDTYFSAEEAIENAMADKVITSL